MAPGENPAQSVSASDSTCLDPTRKKGPTLHTGGEKKGRGELLRLHLGQMNFFQFKSEVIRDSIKDPEAVCSFAPGSHPYSNNLGRKKHLD